MWPLLPAHVPVDLHSSLPLLHKDAIIGPVHPQRKCMYQNKILKTLQNRHTVTI